MEVDLSRTWDGRRAPPRCGGRALLALHGERLELSWDLRIPFEPRAPDGEPGFRDGLWEWDVVELFLRGERPESEGSVAYVELEFGIRRHWLALAFAAVRRRAGEMRNLAPLVVSDVEGHRWRGRAELPAGVIEEHAGPPPWRGLVAAVVSGAPASSGDATTRVHLCWPAVPGERPDFHQPAAWAPLAPRRTR